MSDEVKPKRWRRAKFVKMNVSAREELRERLWVLRGTERRGGRLVDVGVDVAYVTASWTFDLLADANWETGAIPLSDSALAIRSGLSRHTVKRRADLLALAGVIVGVAGQRRFTEGAMAWLRDGEYPPMDEVTAGLMRYAADHPVGAPRTVEGVHQSAAGVHHSAAGVHHSTAGVHHSTAAETVDNPGLPTLPGAQAPEAGGELSVDVKDGKTYQTGSAVDWVMELLDDRLPTSAGSDALREQCRRLTETLGWAPKQIVDLVVREAGNAKTPGLWVNVLRLVKHRPPAPAGQRVTCGECDDGWITDDVTRRPLRKCECLVKKAANGGAGLWRQSA